MVFVCSYSVILKISMFDVHSVEKSIELVYY